MVFLSSVLHYFFVKNFEYLTFEHEPESPLKLASGEEASLFRYLIVLPVRDNSAEGILF